ncbi:hypothetical protein [Rheinheimera gaetbuli]
MHRTHILIICFSVLLVVLFVAFATSHIWLAGARDNDLGNGLIAVGVFAVAYIGLSLGVVAATVVAFVTWLKQAESRKKPAGASLVLGLVVSLLAIAYAFLFVLG